MRLVRVLLLAMLPLLALGCDDDLNEDWVEIPDTVTLFSLSRPALIGEPSGYDFFNSVSGSSGVPVVVETPTAAGRWDIAITDQGGTFSMVPVGAFTGITSRAGIATIPGGTLESLAQAPGDTAAYSSRPVQLRVGGIYVVRSRRDNCFVVSGSRYAKLEILELNNTAGTVRFRAVTNPYCNDRRLIPPD